MSKKLKKALLQLFLFFLLSCAFSCANIVAPTGGPIDVTPPKIKKSEPPNHSPNFTGDKIRITFDEYVFLEDQANQIVVSPPTDKAFDFDINGKSVVVSLLEDLQDSVTYTIYFGESIKDITENNPLRNFEFSFSKSNILDSLSMQGRVFDALTLDPQPGIFVMLYSSDDDSVPVKSKPGYITKTSADGSFILKNLAKKKYKIFALKDMNADMQFNQPNELIAFADSMLSPQYISTGIDTVRSKKDSSSAKQDSLYLPEQIRTTDLYLFYQPDTIQKLLKVRTDAFHQFKLVFKHPVKNLNIQVSNKDLPENWKIEEYSKTKDTITCWVYDTQLDTLKCRFTDSGFLIDTAEIVLKKISGNQKPVKKPSGKGLGFEEEADKLSITTNAASGKLPYFLPLKFTLGRPVSKTDFSKIILEEKTDSIFNVVQPEGIFEDTVYKRAYILKYKWISSGSYRIKILPGAYTDMYGQINDSLIGMFTVSRPEDYGRLLFTLKQNESGKKYLVQLLKEDKSLLEQKQVDKSGQIIFNNLGPANYMIRIVNDLNNNNKWDEGDYFKRRQPEPVIYFPNVINIRANWDTEYEFVL